MTMPKRNRYVEDHVHHLPEVGPAFRGTPGRLTHTVYYHDDHCQIFVDGKRCTCDPTLRVFVEPKP
jgi:hypothetical protein